ncbi:MAG: chemotaxis response regulator protein-glutamate methylesterase [Bacillota bacterium]|nr:chemotaxis response regulator protein-glutamate methylesterase [Bacillota bacterium]
MAKTKVLVVDDSAFMRQVLSDIISFDKSIEVIGTARNGIDALAKIESLKPDVITLDVQMPVMDGFTTLELIMTKYELPVIMLSSLTSEGTEATVKALEKGAVDFILKPVGFDMSQLKAELISKIKLAAKVNVHKPLTIQKNITIKPVNLLKSKCPHKADQIVLIGTSTGGPKALQEVLPLFPKNFPAPILVVQHMPPGFTKSLAERLNSLSAITVKEAEHGEAIEPGFAYIAPGDYHLMINNNQKCISIKLTKDNLVSGHRPSVNVMMTSVCENFKGYIIGVILTGMGSDGTEGMKFINKIKGRTIAEDESTCVVYGMPKAAVLAGCVDIVVPIFDITSTIIKSLR